MPHSSSLDFRLVQRVCLLQQALDQALESLEELRAQVQDKQWVEAQLANTEKYANVQQQAVNHLKQQLGQFTDIQGHLLKVTAFRLNHLIDQQQLDFDRLSLHFQQGHSELQSYLKHLGQKHREDGDGSAEAEENLLALKAEVMMARSMVASLSKHLSLAKQQIDTIRAELKNQHFNLAHIIKTLHGMIDDLASFGGYAQSTPEKQSQPASPAPDSCLAPTGYAEMDMGDLQTLARRQSLRIHQLETALTEHIEQEAQLRQRFQTLAAERDFYKQQLAKLGSAPAQLDVTLTTEPIIAPGLPSLAHTQRLSAPPRRMCSSQPIQPLKLSDRGDLQP